MSTPVGEEDWLAFVEEAVRTAKDVEDYVNVFETYKAAAATERGSLRIWLACCNFVSSLWRKGNGPSSAWPEEEREVMQEIFSLDTATRAWEDGYDAIQYRVADSDEFWSQWIDFELSLLSTEQPDKGIHRIERIKTLFCNRLQVPHMSWDATSQRLSSFLSEYQQDAWEDTMKRITTLSQPAQKAMADREPFELKIKQYERQEDLDLQKSAMREYLEWEVMQSRIDRDGHKFTFNLAIGLFSRALTGILRTDESVWYDQISFVSAKVQNGQPLVDVLDILRRSVQHCPGSGRLWSRYILTAEELQFELEDIESIKNTALAEKGLYVDGMESAIQVCESWCAYLMRQVSKSGRNDEAVENAKEMTRATLDEVKNIGKTRFGKGFQGDPKLRLDHIYIQLLTETAQDIRSARDHWEMLAKLRLFSDSYEFWLQYYTWELKVFAVKPARSTSGLTYPTSVLARAAAKKSIDWPEKIFEIYVQQCKAYEEPNIIRNALDTMRRSEKAVRKRREREEQDRAAEYAAYYGSHPIHTLETENTTVTSPSGHKRKIISAQDQEEGTSSKRQRTEAATDTEPPQQDEQKRDRENSTVVVKNLPENVTQTKVRHYFKEYGHIKNITAMIREADGKSATAIIEFGNPEEAETALLRDKKYFGQSQITVESGHDLTVYVANFPPEANDQYIRELFSDCGEIMSIRWPSLKVNTRRRFCYLTFRDRENSAKAVQKNGIMLDGKYELLANYSDPSRKKNREGALSEGREIHLSSLDTAISEDEIKAICSKFGNVTRVNLPKNMSGRNKGFAFIDFATKDEALLAVSELDSTKIRNQIVKAQLSKDSKVKHTSTTVSAIESETSKPNLTSELSSGPFNNDIHQRTVVLLGLPDTVNDARVRAVVEPLGPIKRLVLVPAKGAATIEFNDAPTAGKASLQLDNVEFEGSKLRIGSLAELHQAKGEKGAAPTQKGSVMMPRGLAPTQSTRNRPAVPGRRRRGGLAIPPTMPHTTPTSAHAESPGGSNDKTQKSNADFKAMFLQPKVD